jgi:hypothetical protein
MCGKYTKARLSSYLKLSVRSASNVCSSLHNCFRSQLQIFLQGRDAAKHLRIYSRWNGSSNKRLRCGDRVALKFVSEELARDARDGAISSRSACPSALNHTNICKFYEKRSSASYTTPMPPPLILRSMP